MVSIIMQPVRNSYGFLYEILDSSSNMIILQENDNLPAINYLNTEENLYLLLKNENQQEYVEIINSSFQGNNKVITLYRGVYNTNIHDWNEGTKVVLQKGLNIDVSTKSLCDVTPYDEISYDNSVSKLLATTVQGALDELDSRLDTLEYDLNKDHIPYYAHRITLNSFDEDFNKSNVQDAIEELFYKKSSKYHTHPNYYLQSEIDSFLSGKSDSTHDHNSIYYTKTQLENSGSSQIHWDNITNTPLQFATEPKAEDISFSPITGLDNTNIQSALETCWLESSRSTHTHSNLYYTITQLSLDSSAEVHWNNIVERPQVEYTSGITVYDSSENLDDYIKSLKTRIKELEDANTAMSNIQLDNFTLKNVNNRFTVDSRFEKNIMLNAFRLSSFTEQQDIIMSDSIIDEFKTIDNIEYNDTYYYSSTEKVIFPIGWNTEIVNHKYRRKITVDNTKVSSTITNYTLLVKLTTSNFDFDIYRDGEGELNGNDILFYLINNDGSQTKLYYEKTYFNYASGNELGVFWVRLPEVDSSENTEIYIYYGNTESESESTTSSWNTNYEFVGHVSNDNTKINNSLDDSYLNPNSIGSMESGIIWKSIKLNGSNYYQSNETININSTDSFSISMLFKPTSVSHITERTLLSFTDGSDDFKATIGGAPQPNNRIYFRANSENVNILNIDNNWHLITVVYNRDSSLIVIYLDNNSPVSKTFSTTIDGDFTLKVGDSSNGFEGMIEEIRVYKEVKTTSWVKSNYYSMIDGSFWNTSSKELINSDTDMELISTEFSTEEVPETAKLIIFEEKLNDYTISNGENDGLKAYISRDGNLWNRAELERDNGYDGNLSLINGTVSLTNQSSYNKIYYKIKTSNGAMMKLHGVSMIWG